MDFRVDRTLPMPVGQQLRGSIEFGIAFGELVVGAALPSVREMAVLAGVAPMTVSQVYQELKKEGLVEARLGSGTFICDSSRARAARRADIETLHARIDAAIDQARVLGVDDLDLATMVNARLVYARRAGRKTDIVMAGLFPDATASYADYIELRLGRGAHVEPMTIADLREHGELRARAGSADLIVTFTNRHAEVLALLPRAKVVTIRFIPSETTRMSLASINPTARVLVLSRFPDFLPIFRAGVRRFASHVPDVKAINYDDPKVEEHLQDCDVVVYATGTEATAEQTRAGIHKFEYRHIPDPSDIDRVLLPLIDRTVRGAHQQKETA